MKTDILNLSIDDDLIETDFILNGKEYTAQIIIEDDIEDILEIGENEVVLDCEANQIIDGEVSTQNIDIEASVSIIAEGEIIPEIDVFDGATVFYNDIQSISFHTLKNIQAL